MLEIGVVLAARYRVLELLGEGGMGAVYRAENVVTGKLVALKWMHAQVARNSDASERLLREARAASRLSHPNVVDVYDVVQDAQTFFLVMELLQGETLRRYLERGGRQELHEFIALILPALAGVIAAHECGVIHRDLKPDNIFLARIPGSKAITPKVLDFGIAKLASNPGLALTQTGAAIGTPLYMSLEQLRGDRDIDARTDVYAFGVMLYEAITGRMPHQAATLPELAIKVATLDPEPVKALRPDIPTSLARLVDWALVRDRAKRLPDLRTLHQELEAFASEARFRRQMTDPAGVAPALFASAELAGAPRTVMHHAVAAEQRAPGHAADSGERRDHPAARAQPDTLTARELSRGGAGKRRTGRFKSSRWIVGLAGVGLGVAAALYVSTLPDVAEVDHALDATRGAPATQGTNDAPAATGFKPVTAGLPSPAEAQAEPGAPPDDGHAHAPPIVLNAQTSGALTPTPTTGARPMHSSGAETKPGHAQAAPAASAQPLKAGGASREVTPREAPGQERRGSGSGVTAGQATPQQPSSAAPDAQRASAAHEQAVGVHPSESREPAAKHAPAAETARKGVAAARKSEAVPAGARTAPAPVQARAAESASPAKRDAAVQETQAPRKKSATELVGF